MTPDDDGITWFLAWICLKVKPLLFDYLPPWMTVLEHKQPEKVWKWPFLRHFTAKNDTRLWQHHLIFGVNMSQSHTIIVQLFATFNGSFITQTTWKTIKNAIFTAFYGILRHCVHNSFPNVLYNFFWLLCNICDWFRAKNLPSDQISKIA